jgi:hypothetical protein
MCEEGRNTKREGKEVAIAIVLVIGKERMEKVQMTAKNILCVI